MRGLISPLKCISNLIFAEAFFFAPMVIQLYFGVPRMNKLDLIVASDAFIRGARKYLESNSFIDMSYHMPVIVGVTGACENVNTLYKIDNKKLFLAQSDQLYLEIWTPKVPSGKLYCMIPSSRNEVDVDKRHLNQFPLLELEMLGELDELISQIENTIKSGISKVLDTNVEVDRNYLKLIVASPFKRIRYTDALEFLKKKGFDLIFGDDLLHSHEITIANHFGPVFITHYPLEIKFFNMKQNSEDPHLVNSCDLILPCAGESTGAAERETEYHKIVSRLKASPMYRTLIQQGIEDNDFEWYLNEHLNPDGSQKQIPNHSGCGIGLARIMQFIFNAEDIHDVMLYPIDASMK